MRVALRDRSRNATTLGYGPRFLHSTGQLHKGGANTGVPTFPHVTCGNGPNGDLFYDYMDYSDDACMNQFTTGQGSRASQMVAAYR